MPQDVLQQTLNNLREMIAEYPGHGAVTDAIDELGGIDPAKFGIAVADLRGSVWTVGDAQEAFSIQSISKVFMLGLALGRLGDTLWTRVGREPSGTAFNSIVQLEYEGGIPRNPFINAGALVVTDAVLGGRQPKETIGEFLRFVRVLSDDNDIYVDESVARSEAETAHRNRALAHYLKAHNNLNNQVDPVLGVYVHQCAVAMNCMQLAKAGLFLAQSGKRAGVTSSVLSQERARRINALMMTCGLYDGSGDFAFRVGLPAKSGIGGAILAIVPGKASIAVWSPGLDQQGNSQLGIIALERLTSTMNWSVFGA